jgi:predicted DNA repair protein MutK
VEKLAHKFLHDKHEDQQHYEALVKAVQDENVDMLAFEKDKIRGAIRTDFILSAEIIVISLGTLVGRTFTEQLMTLVAISLIMTVGVYGLVAGIVKLDDAGLALTGDARPGGWAGFKRAFGRGILRSAPWLMKFLSIAGTAAMFLVGGGILVHSVPALHHLIEPYVHGSFGWLVSMLYNAAVGIAMGIIVLVVVKAVSRLRKPATGTAG